MKVTVKRAALETALYAAFRVVEPKTPNTILTGIHLECKDGRLIATGSNIVTTITRSVPIEPGDSQNGAVVVPGKKFYDLIKKIDRELVELDTTSDAITIKYGNKTTMKTFAENEFPYAPTVDRVDYELKAEEFASALKIYPFCYTGTDRPIFTGVAFNITPFGAEFSATDTHRLAVSRATMEGNDVKTIVPQEAIKESINLLSGTIRITVEEQKMVAFRDDTTCIYSMVVAGVPAQFDKLFSGEFTTKIELTPKSILPALDRISSVQEKANIVKMSLNGDLELSFDGEISTIQEKVSVASHDGEFTAHLNIKYLQEAFQMYASDEKVTMFFENDPTRPCKIEGDNISMILFPLRLE